MSKRHTIIGSGQYNFDIIKVREYPNGFIIGKRNPYNETIIAEEVGGAKGLRFMLNGGRWIHLEPQKVDNVVDWEGCGDTVSAIFINELGKMGLPKISDLTEGQVESALQEAVKKSALCTQYYGSKGWIKAKNRFYEE